MGLAVVNGLIAVDFSKQLAVAPAIALHLDDRAHRPPIDGVAGPAVAGGQVRVRFQIIRNLETMHD